MFLVQWSVYDQTKTCCKQELNNEALIYLILPVFVAYGEPCSLWDNLKSFDKQMSLFSQANSAMPGLRHNVCHKKLLLNIGI